jgi:hypothetical protein
MVYLIGEFVKNGAVKITKSINKNKTAREFEKKITFKKHHIMTHRIA